MRPPLDDGSSLVIKTAPGNSTPNVPAGAKLLKDGTELDMDLADGGSIKLTLADPGSSVALRDKNHQVEYMG